MSPLARALDSPEAAGLDQLNALRASAGMSALSRDAALDTAAANHSNYLLLNNVSGHYESPGAPGFTGIAPVDRTVHAGYLSRSVSENVSYGTDSVAGSIDDLMSSIYHRFAFLQEDIDEIGIGIRDRFYTYNMGHTGLNALCEAVSFDGSGAYYFNVCADPAHRVEQSAFDDVKRQTAEGNPALIIWPPPGGREIPPAFFEENPDPLPGHSVTGYPVSVEFNEWRTQHAVSVQAFSLFDDGDAEVSYAHRVLQPSDDVNGIFDAYQFAVFPLKRLEWGRTYRAQFDYLEGGAAKSLTWRFTTRGLPHRYYRLENEIDAQVDVVTGETYSVYFVPEDSNDRFGNFSYSYYGGMSVDAEFVDGNTINVTITGAVGQQAVFTLGNGLQLTLTVSATDNALDNTIPPDSDQDGLNDLVDNCPAVPNGDQQDTDEDALGDACDSDDDGDGLSDTDEIDVHGTNPLLKDSDGDGMLDSYEIDNGLDARVDDAQADKDGDGISNLDEMRAGSDPSDPNDPDNANEPLPQTRGAKLLQAILPLLLD